MEEIDEGRKTQIAAAESYLHARQHLLPSTIRYVYTNTYNYIMSHIKRYV